MILKKPYAFLIKHFRVIHIVITFLLVLCGIKWVGIFNFFNDYVTNNYTTRVTIGLANEYTPSYLFWMVLLIIALVVTIVVLLFHKKKQNKLYLLMVVYYILLFIGLIYLKSVLQGFETALLESTAARSIRDILLIISFPQLVFIIYMGLRSVGFNLKQFNFASDLKELEYTDSDAEEIEISLNFETYRAKRSARRVIREMIYYVKENKFIVICILTVALVIGGYYLTTHTSANYDSKYGMGSSFNYNGLFLTFKDSIITDINYRGKTINPGKYYLVLKINVKNNSGNSISLDYNSFKLAIGSEVLTPVNNYSKNFLDYAPTTVPTMFTPKIDKDFILIYELEPSQIKKSMKMQIYNGSVYIDGKAIAKNIYIKINPKILPGLSLKGNYAIEEEINFSDTYLKSTLLKINGYQINKTYRYQYEVCHNHECQKYDDMLSAPFASGRSENVILTLDTDLYQDNEAVYTSLYTTYYDFANNFVSIKYRYNDEVYENRDINVTPQQNISFMAFEVPKEIQEASVIQVVIRVRNKEYIVNLKA